MKNTVICAYAQQIRGKCLHTDKRRDARTAFSTCPGLKLPASPDSELLRPSYIS